MDDGSFCGRALDKLKTSRPFVANVLVAIGLLNDADHYHRASLCSLGRPRINATEMDVSHCHFLNRLHAISFEEPVCCFHGGTTPCLPLTEFHVSLEDTSYVRPTSQLLQGTSSHELHPRVPADMDRA